MNESEDDEALSSISELFSQTDKDKFIKIYNKQGNYSATQSVETVFSKCISLRGARRVVKLLAYLTTSVLIIFMYLSLVDAFSEKVQE